MTETNIKSCKKSKLDLIKRIKWRKCLAYLAIVIILIYVISLIILNTPWAKDKLTDRLREKSNSDWELGSVIWVPLGDIVLNDLKTKMGEGGINIKSISVEPSWKLLFSGLLEIHEATLSEANVDIDLKWMAENRGKFDEIIPLHESEPTQQLQQPLPPEPTKPIEKPALQPTQNPKQKPTQIPAQEVITEQKIIDLPNRWLKLENINFTLRNGKDIIEKVSDISASIPISGKPVDGEVRFKFLDHEHIQKVSWDGLELKAEETRGKFCDVNFQWRAVCRINQLGMPFAFQFIVPPQKLNYTLDKPNIHLSISADEIAANFMMRGGLKNPFTWRGILNAASEKTTIIENQKTHKRIDFDYTRLAAALTNSTFHVPVAEAIGYKTSILANGVVHKNLYSYGVVRIITNPESSAMFEKVYRGTKVIKIDHSPDHFLTPLNTPDRLYCDIYLDGKLTNLEIRHERADHWQDLKPVIKKLLDFKNSELKEDGIFELE